MKKAAPSFHIIPVAFVLLITFSTINRILEGNKNNACKKHSTNNVLTERVIDSIENEAPLPLDEIRQNSLHRKRRAYLNALPVQLKPIKKSFFRKWLANAPVTGKEKKLIFLPGNADYHFYDFAETNDLFLFSIIMRNAHSAQDELIHFTCDKATGKMRHAEWIATNGGEGGHSCQSKMEYSASRLKLIVTSEIYQPVDDRIEWLTRVIQYTFESDKTIERELKQR
jgi:hypothetical protein